MGFRPESERDEQRARLDMWAEAHKVAAEMEEIRAAKERADEAMMVHLGYKRGMDFGGVKGMVWTDSTGGGVGVAPGMSPQWPQYVKVEPKPKKVGVNPMRLGMALEWMRKEKNRLTNEVCNLSKDTPREIREEMTTMVYHYEAVIDSFESF